MTALAHAFSPRDEADAARKFAALSNWMSSSSGAQRPTGTKLVLSKGSEKIFQQVSAGGSFEERLFHSLVSLKVSISTFAMHLSAAERARLFEALDDTINVDDWHEGDKLPAAASFQQFLRWMIYSGNENWTSLGVSDAGTILIAWRKPKVLLTADFEASGNVRWTARLTGEDEEIGTTAGRCSLKLFAEQANFYLKR